MRLLDLDCRTMEDRADFYRQLRLCMGWPKWMGQNLDALYELASSETRRVCLRLRYVEALERCLGEAYAQGVRATLLQAANEGLGMSSQWLRMEAPWAK